METSENKAIIQCQQGDLEKFGRLYDVYIKKIYDFVYYKTFHKETAEDLTSQTFTKALENINRYDQALGSFSSWLYRIARNTIIDHYRTKKETVDINDVWSLASSCDIQRDTDIKRRITDLQRYLCRLKPEQREIIIMRIWNELSYEKISYILNKSENSCMTGPRKTEPPR